VKHSGDDQTKLKSQSFDERLQNPPSLEYPSLTAKSSREDCLETGTSLSDEENEMRPTSLHSDEMPGPSPTAARLRVVSPPPKSYLPYSGDYKKEMRVCKSTSFDCQKAENKQHTPGNVIDQPPTKKWGQDAETASGGVNS
jgi:hypothetical protein